MIPSSDVLEGLWKIVAGLLIGGLLGAFGVGLLVRAAWQWLIGRTESSGHPMARRQWSFGKAVEPPARGSSHLARTEGSPMHRKRLVSARTLVTVLVGAITLLGAAQVYASTLEAVKSRGVLIVGVREDFPPLGYLDGEGRNTGFEVDLARYLARQLLGEEGKLRLVRVNAGNRLTAILSGSADMLIASVSATEDRAAVFALSEPYFLSGTLLLVPRGSPIQDVLDVKGKRVAVLEGTIQEGAWEPVVREPVVRGVIRVQLRNVAAAVAALRAGQVDALAEDDVLILALARQYPDLVAVGKPFRPHPYAIAMHKDNGELRAWVNEQLRQAKADGTYDTLWNRYFGDAAAILLRP